MTLSFLLSLALPIFYSIFQLLYQLMHSTVMLVAISDSLRLHFTMNGASILCKGILLSHIFLLALSIFLVCWTESRLSILLYFRLVHFRLLLSATVLSFYLFSALNLITFIHSLISCFAASFLYFDPIPLSEAYP